LKVSGFSFVRNAIRFDYPFLESVRSALPLCHEFILAVGRSEDDTLEAARTLDPRKVRILETVWDESQRVGGTVLAQQTNLALAQVSGDWALYLQADEVLHEADYPAIEGAMQRYLDDRRVEGLLFSFRHFYGSYAHVGASRRWYRREIRIVRPSTPGLSSWRDAQGFRAAGRKLAVKLVPATIHHYGWVKSPQHQQAKQQSFNRYWHPDEWLEKNVGRGSEYDYRGGGRLKPFTGAHPAVMTDRVRRQDWEFRYDPRRARGDLKTRILDRIEDATGVRIGEYRNYRLI